MMSLLKSAEEKLAGVYKDAPKLSESSKATIVNVLPWLALIGGILQALSALNLIRWARAAGQLDDMYRAIGADIIASSHCIWVYLALIMAAIQALLLLIAFPKLQNRQKAGWDVLLLVGLLNIAYGVVGLLIGTGYAFGGIGNLIWNVLVSAIAFWLLFAVRNKYKGGGFKIGDMGGSQGSEHTKKQ